MKRIIFPVLFAGLTITACTKSEKTSDTVASSADSTAIASDVQTNSSTAIPAGDTTENSVDWNGTYTGTLPCASCPGIETTLTLNSDKTYEIKEVYQEEKDGKFDEKGSFLFDASGSFITLQEKDSPNGGRVFFVGENQMWMVSKVGDRSFKDEYKLTKK